MTNYWAGMEQGKNIRAFASYMEEKVIAICELTVDFSKEIHNPLREMPINEKLFQSAEVLQRQIASLLGCKFYLDSIDNDITLEAIRILIKDLFRLYQNLNEAIVNILGGRMGRRVVC